ncbi:TadE/TadG family type IV pilus assembly protein [Methylobacterium sp. PvR107]|uniref:TadE/TadG family type IV pilus assembly protein n=1 Tax=Methylobacterium sp. PvR107 TaxID=2806597 RepID=UPI001B64F636|nr:TadE/TadG family type IV pilus assembly protein [Methylobacterium sp. PvR107]MBP1178128.1 Flp pilus assembly protein TadG [Methylobacterium sp. PvR107]
MSLFLCGGSGNTHANGIRMAGRSRTRTSLAPSRQRPQRVWRRFHADNRGAVALIFALAGTVLIGLVGGGIDYTRMVYRRSQMQNAADGAVLAGGNTLKLSPSNSTAVASIVQRIIVEQAPSPPDCSSLHSI